MKKQGIFSVSQFAKLSRMTRDIVLNYDKLGLISPAGRRGNNYRYYSSDQLAIANIIRMQLELGTPLTKIKQLMDERTPENICNMFIDQEKLINAKIKELSDIQKLMTMLNDTISSSFSVDEQAITIQYLPEKTIMLGNLNDYSNGRNDYDALQKFYIDMGEKYPNVNLNYPVWAIFSKERIENGDWVFPDRYYCYHHEGCNKKPAALYAIGYTRGGYGQTTEVYKRLIDYIDQNNFEICGDTYEEYPLNEICISDSSNYLIRVTITIQEKR